MEIKIARPLNKSESLKSLEGSASQGLISISTVFSVTSHDLQGVLCTYVLDRSVSRVFFTAHFPIYSQQNDPLRHTSAYVFSLAIVPGAENAG